MGATTATIVCSHCEAENTPSREICYRCREPLHLENGFAPSLPSVFNEPVESQQWATRVWHEVCAPGTIVASDGGPGADMIVREVGTDSLVFDSDNTYLSNDAVVLEFEMEGQKFKLATTARKTARTLGMEMCFATTVDLTDPGDAYISTVTQMNPVDEKAWWD